MTQRKVVQAVLVAGAFLGPVCAQSIAQNKCSNPTINEAYTKAMTRPPNGSGTSGECNPALYGSYTSEHDLELKIVAYHNPKAAPAAPAVVALAVPASYTFYIDPKQNMIANTLAHTVIAPAGTWDLRNPDGSAVSLVAQGGGNLVAQGGGNLVAQGGGNLTGGGYSLKSVGGKKVFVVKK